MGLCRDRAIQCCNIVSQAGTIFCRYIGFLGREKFSKARIFFVATKCFYVATECGEVLCGDRAILCRDIVGHAEKIFYRDGVFFCRTELTRQGVFCCDRVGQGMEELCRDKAVLYRDRVG